MNKELFYLLVILCILAHITRAVYEILKHKKIIKASKLSFMVVFISMMLLWISWFGLCPLDSYKVELPDLVRYLGMFLVVAGVIIFLTSLLTIKALESYEGNLIRHGIYSKIRHPMYLAFILWLIGMPLQFGGILTFILGIIFIANVLFWRHLEEKELVQRFPEYEEYRKKTIF